MTIDEELDLPHRRRAASALNRLAHALVKHRARTEVLDAIASEADRLAASIEQEPERERQLEFVESVRVREAKVDGGNPAAPDGAFVDMFDDSPVSGSANPLTMGLKIATYEDHAVGRVTLLPGWQGAPGRAHGGATAALVVAPCPIGAPLEFTARRTGADGRKHYLECTGEGPDGVFITATSTFIEVDLSSFERDASGS